MENVTLVHAVASKTISVLLLLSSFIVLSKNKC